MVLHGRLQARLGRWLKGPVLKTQGDMNPRICVCCGEPIAEEGNSLSRNPNVCPSCSSMADGMEGSNVPACGGPAPLAEAAEKTLSPGPDDTVLELAEHLVWAESAQQQAQSADAAASGSLFRKVA